jgi:ABC-type nitrate/sulfonate/bicarbonate transport system ATPase subunit
VKKKPDGEVDARSCHAGIGKSTLLNLIGGSLEPTKGTITRNPKVPEAVLSGQIMVHPQPTSTSIQHAAFSPHCLRRR